MPRAWIVLLGLTCAAAAQGWRVPARLHHGFVLSTDGELSAGADGIRFTPAKGAALAWRFDQIATLDLAPRALIVVVYAPRRWHLPGLRRWRFELGAALPPAEAARLEAALGRPARDAVPDPAAAAWLALPAYADGQNGELRLTDAGVDFITVQPGAARHFAWRDIEALTRPDPWHLGVGAYRGDWQAQLKSPLSAADFDRLWERFEGGRGQ